MSFTSLPQLAGFMQVLGLSGWQWTMNSSVKNGSTAGCGLVGAEVGVPDADRPVVEHAHDRIERLLAAPRRLEYFLFALAPGMDASVSATEPPTPAQDRRAGVSDDLRQTLALDVSTTFTSATPTPKTCTLSRSTAA